jgi:ATP-dependent Lon protease
MIILDDLDKKALELFRGFVVKKDLVGIIKGGANVWRRLRGEGCR